MNEKELVRLEGLEDYFKRHLQNGSDIGALTEEDMLLCAKALNAYKMIPLIVQQSESAKTAWNDEMYNKGCNDAIDILNTLL